VPIDYASLTTGYYHLKYGDLIRESHPSDIDRSRCQAARITEGRVSRARCSIDCVPDDAKERFNRINDASPARRHRGIGASVHPGPTRARARSTPACDVHSSRALLPVYWVGRVGGASMNREQV